MQSNINSKDPLIGNPDWGKSKYCFFNDLRVHYRVAGEESHPPIVLIHGFGASSDHWRNNAEIFAAAGFRIYGIDLIGFGKSEQNLKGKINHLDNQFWSNQLAYFLDEIAGIKENRKVILIGNSLGALTAITPLLPNRLKKVKSFLIKVFFNLFPIKALVNLISSTQLITFGLQSAYFRSILNDNLLKRIVTIPARRPNSYQALRAMCIGMTNRPNATKGPSIIKKIQNIPNRPPILLIWGEKDKLIPIFLAKKLIKLHPWLKLMVINDAGHCLHDELPNHFNQIVLKWLT